MPVKVIAVLPSYGSSSGGVGTVVSSHAHGFAQSELVTYSVADLCSNDRYDDSITVHSHKSVAGFSPALSTFLKKQERSVIHQHGIWHPVSSAVVNGVSKSSPLLLSPHGMMEKWIVQRNSWKKTIAKLLYESKLWRKAAAFHALTLKEVEDIRETTGTKSPIVYIPNGIELKDVSEKQLRNNELQFIYMGRFHSKKGLANLIDAWKLFIKDHPGHTLKLVGWGDQDLLSAAQGESSISILEPVFEERAKQLLLNDADYFILPSFSEGLPMVVLEAWAQRTPVLMTQECNLPEGFAEKAAIEIRPNIESILDGLKRAVALDPSGRLEMGNNARRLVEKSFSMQIVLERLSRLYQWLDGEPVSISDLRCQ